MVGITPITKVAGLALALLATLVSPAHARIKGDLTCSASGPEAPCSPDGTVDMSDVMLLARHLSGLATLPPALLPAADVGPPGLEGAADPEPGPDGSVDVVDLLILSRYAWSEDVDRDGLPGPESTAQRTSEWYLADSDGDGLCDGSISVPGICIAGELLAGTDPSDLDSDDDHLCDGPADGPRTHASGSCDFGEDLDGDGILDAGETDPKNADTDFDGLADGAEDADRNGWELGQETNPRDDDTDGDGLCDGKALRVYDGAGNFLCTGSEQSEGTNPLLANSDGAGPNDGEEAALGIECPNCFAVLVLTDTQYYTTAKNNDPSVSGANHLRLFAEYACGHRGAGGASLWREPRTKKLMPIRMVLHLGDLTESNLPAEWAKVDAMFDDLDACSMPYVTVPGNHDVTPLRYSASMDRYNRHFAAPCVPATGGSPLNACEDSNNPYYQGAGNPSPVTPRAGWASHHCVDPPCTGAGEWWWFVGNGDDVAAFSRDSQEPTAGPPTAEPGRHRAVAIDPPGPGKMLFIGLDLGMDLVDLVWVHDLLDRYSDTRAVLVQHYAFLGGGDSFSESGYGSDTIGAPGLHFGKDLLQNLMEGHPNVFLTLNGHWGSLSATSYHEWADSGVTRIMRDFQWVRRRSGDPYGNGWNVIAVVDPDAGEVRLRSYRIDDADNYRTDWLVGNGFPAVLDEMHDGAVEESGLLDRDYEIFEHPTNREVVITGPGAYHYEE
jgi:hypothetical protein